ncbi:hypothetical protein TNCT_478591 [Trichonephila clavata]|uniref:Uncharacterized protein n=1 Tax=Trichonephila clavata TaxID=2740835 RepID=A0A8X6FEY6_TRICU|nr:hypothetical protein TNCT_478591 [Trichonephila clavata]
MVPNHFGHVKMLPCTCSELTFLGYNGVISDHGLLVSRFVVVTGITRYGAYRRIGIDSKKMASQFDPLYV